MRISAKLKNGITSNMNTKTRTYFGHRLLLTYYDDRLICVIHIIPIKISRGGGVEEYSFYTKDINMSEEEFMSTYSPEYLGSE